VQRDEEEPWSPVGPLLIALAALAVVAAGAYLLRQERETVRITGSMLVVVGQFGVFLALFRALVDRAAHFAASGVPTAWTRPDLRGLKDVNLRQWENTIREMRPPWPDEATLLAAARARATGASLIAVLGVLALLASLAGFVLVLRDSPPVLRASAPANHVLGLLACYIGVRYAIDGRRARAYLARYGH
jgi:hypothetical protein